MKIRYGKTFNTGNYTSERIELEVENVKKENIPAVFDWLKERVIYLHEFEKRKEQEKMAEHMEVEKRHNKEEQKQRDFVPSGFETP